MIWACIKETREEIRDRQRWDHHCPPDAWINIDPWCATGKRFKGMADPGTHIEDEISSDIQWCIKEIPCVFSDLPEAPIHDVSSRLCGVPPGSV